ncbi:MAG: acetolactate decarboxylase [Armatimonadota bacterium]
MKSFRSPIVVIICLLITSLPAFTRTVKENDTVYQISTIDALMYGLYDGVSSIGDLKKHGDIGLGTFDALDGEMVVVDGKVFKITSDGAARMVDGAEMTPFAAVTHFDKDISREINIDMDMSALSAFIDSLIPSKNLFYAIRIDGVFSVMKTRSVPRQQKPYRKLIQVVAEQPVFDFENVKGTVVGFRCPYYVKGSNVPGYHLYFINDDRSKGGHVLALVIKDAVVHIDTSAQVRIVLPETGEFLKAEIDPGTASDLDKVEK